MEKAEGERERERESNHRQKDARIETTLTLAETDKGKIGYVSDENNEEIESFTCSKCYRYSRTKSQLDFKGSITTDIFAK